jgi:hypothetical protein
MPVGIGSAEAPARSFAKTSRAPQLLRKLEITVVTPNVESLDTMILNFFYTPKLPRGLAAPPRPGPEGSDTPEAAPIVKDGSKGLI